MKYRKIIIKMLIVFITAICLHDFIWGHEVVVTFNKQVDEEQANKIAKSLSLDSGTRCFIPPKGTDTHDGYVCLLKAKNNYFMTKFEMNQIRQDKSEEIIVIRFYNDLSAIWERYEEAAKHF
ncbi:hypothetical protein [Paenibacillus sp. NEAU-GSW1]|uniref:hypothetical protein n=1 Tax=Paenibacillus sp. NEAU-GSW1 TaxID=2682486 RepID=UPI0012E116BC|nr:hypothetical protein [Paenibacillus sp. NEAU-GSW1]MUT67482.1 hypothetical protein [Paenibacillus sp. NEAU-GSW1]